MLRAMPVSLQCELRSAIASQTATVLNRRAGRMLRALGLERAELSLLICGDARIHALNAAYRGIDKPTDVLAFVQGEGLAVPSAGRAVLGDVVISLPTAARKARAARRTLVDEATLLLAHGLLHLLGFDHQTEADWRRMQARTDLLRMTVGGRSRPVGNRRKRAPRGLGATIPPPRSRTKT